MLVGIGVNCLEAPTITDGGRTATSLLTICTLEAAKFLTSHALKTDASLVEKADGEPAVQPSQKFDVEGMRFLVESLQAQFRNDNTAILQSLVAEIATQFGSSYLWSNTFTVPPYRKTRVRSHPKSGRTSRRSLSPSWTKR